MSNFRNKKTSFLVKFLPVNILPGKNTYRKHIFELLFYFKYTFDEVILEFEFYC